MEAKKVMELVDAHVRASVEKFAGGKRDTAASRKAIEAALTEAPAAAEDALTVIAPLPAPPEITAPVEVAEVPEQAMPAEVPAYPDGGFVGGAVSPEHVMPDPPRSKMPRLFGKGKKP